MNKSTNKTKRQVLNELIADNLDYLVRFAMFRVGNRCDAEDIVYDSILRLLDARRIESLSPQNLRMYLYRMVYNRCVDFYRNKGREYFVNIDSESVGDIQSYDDVLDLEEISRLNELLDSLPERESEVVRMNLMDGLSFVEIGQILDIPATTVKSRFKTGMEKLKARYFKNQ